MFNTQKKYSQNPNEQKHNQPINLPDSGQTGGAGREEPRIRETEAVSQNECGTGDDHMHIVTCI